MCASARAHGTPPCRAFHRRHRHHRTAYSCTEANTSSTPNTVSMQTLGWPQSACKGRTHITRSKRIYTLTVIQVESFPNPSCTWHCRPFSHCLTMFLRFCVLKLKLCT